MTHDFARRSTIRLGRNRGSPRIYLQGRWLASAGFEPGTSIHIHFESGRLTLTRGSAGDRRVSAKARIPVIDIESLALSRAFDRADVLQVEARHGSIVITPAYLVLLVARRQLLPTEGSLFSGGGLLTEAARQAGFAPHFAVEIDPRYAQVYEANHPGAMMFNGPVEQVPWELLRSLAPLGLLTLGIPCEPFSVIRTRDRGRAGLRDRSAVPEAHALGDMVFWALRAVEATNPHTVVAEEVPPFLASGAGAIFQQVLRRMGYTVEARVLDPLAYGELTDRRRAILIATTGPAVRWPEPCAPDPPRARLADVLDPPGAIPADAWFDRSTKPWLFDHWDRQTARGNGFASAQLDAASTHVGTIKKRYFAQQGDNPVVRHPDRPGVYRWLSLAEVRRLHGLPEHYELGDSQTTAGEVLGQGVLVGLLRRVIESVTGIGGAAGHRASGRCRASIAT